MKVSKLIVVVGGHHHVIEEDGAIVEDLLEEMSWRVVNKQKRLINRVDVYSTRQEMMDIQFRHHVSSCLHVNQPIMHSDGMES